jgi:transcriptional pleiotropic repressor
MVDDIILKMRSINRLIQRTGGHNVNFQEVVKVLGDVVNSDVYLLDTDGQVLGKHCVVGCQCKTIAGKLSFDMMFPDEVNQWLLALGHTLVNHRGEDGYCAFNEEIKCGVEQETLMVVPMRAGGERIGTLVFVKSGEEFSEGDILVGECSATVFGVEMLCKTAEKRVKEQRTKDKAKMVLESLSFSELKAIKYIFEQIGSDRGVLVTSKVADMIDVTRSVIVNALRKLESAGIIESKSLGMKGTYIRALNHEFLEQLEQVG